MWMAKCNMFWQLWSWTSSQRNLKINRKQNIITNIYRIQAYDLMCGYFCIEFIDFMLKGKGLQDYTILFSHNDYEKNLN